MLSRGFSGALSAMLPAAAACAVHDARQRPALCAADHSCQAVPRYSLWRALFTQSQYKRGTLSAAAALERACKDGDIGTIRLLKRELPGGAVDDFLHDDADILRAVCADGDVSTVRALLEPACASDAPFPSWLGRALRCACESGREDIVRDVLQRVAPRRCHLERALSAACVHNHVNIVQLVLAHARARDIAFNAQQLMHAARDAYTAGSVHALRGVLDAAAALPDVDTARFGTHVMRNARCCGCADVVRLVLDACDVPHHVVRRVFDAACDDGHADVVCLLLRRRGADALRDVDTSHVFALACERGHAALAQALLTLTGEHAVDVHAHDVLRRSCVLGNWDVLDMLLRLTGRRRMECALAKSLRSAWYAPELCYVLRL